MTQALLPSNSTPWEKAVANALAPEQVVVDAIGAIRGTKLTSPPPSFLPFLIWEYGLSELTPYVPNLYDLIEEGIEWQRVRGTHDAVQRGLGWLGYTAAIEEAPTFRRFWNAFQLRFNSLPENDAPDLERIEGVTTLSVPLRSNLRRGVHQYDVTAAELDHSRLDHCMLDFSSGIVATPKGTIWSFGRTHEIDHTLTEAEGLALGNWLADTGAGVGWDPVTWADADFAWTDDPNYQRAVALAGWFEGKRLYIALKDTDDAVIGYRRARAVRPVSVNFEGVYAFGGSDYAPAENGTAVYIEALTQFDDADGVTAESISLIVEPDLAADVKPGKLWLEPSELSGGTEFAAHPTTIPLRKTVREQIKIMLRF